MGEIFAKEFISRYLRFYDAPSTKSSPRWGRKISLPKLPRCCSGIERRRNSFVSRSESGETNQRNRIEAAKPKERAQGRTRDLFMRKLEERKIHKMRRIEITENNAAGRCKYLRTNAFRISNVKSKRWRNYFIVKNLMFQVKYRR